MTASPVCPVSRRRGLRRPTTSPRRLGKFVSPKKPLAPWLVKPKNSPYSDAEWAVAWALTILGVEFMAQHPYHGGRLVPGGAVVDFFISDRNLFIRVQGVYYHYMKNINIISYDLDQKKYMEDEGFTVINIDSDDALSDPIYYVKEALEGRDHSRAETGMRQYKVREII